MYQLECASKGAVHALPWSCWADAPSAICLPHCCHWAPWCSVKDRIAYAMIKDAEERGIIEPGKASQLRTA